MQQQLSLQDFLSMMQTWFSYVALVGGLIAVGLAVGTVFLGLEVNRRDREVKEELEKLRELQQKLAEEGRSTMQRIAEHYKLAEMQTPLEIVTNVRSVFDPVLTALRSQLDRVSASCAENVDDTRRAKDGVEIALREARVLSARLDELTKSRDRSDGR